MKLKVFYFLTFLLISTFLSASGSLHPLKHPNPIAEYTDPCELPPPTDFHVEEQGVTWVKYAWTVGDLQQHRIRTYRASDDFLLNTTTAGAGVSNITVPIPENTECYAIINTICEDGSNSSREANCMPFPGIIVELIVDGYTHNYNYPFCTITSTTPCTLPTSGIVPFWITGNGETKRFGIKRVTTSEEIIFKVYTADVEGETFQFDCSSGFSAPCSPSQNVIIKKRTGPGTIATIAILDLSAGAATNSITGSVSSGYYVQRMVTSIGDPSGGRSNFEHEESMPEKGVRATASPNPFSESLDVFLTHAAAGRVNFKLFNLSGQKVLDQQFAGGKEQYSLSTASLSTGLYLLRIEADGEVQTLKIIKSE